MPDWLRDSVAEDARVPLTDLLFRLALAFVLGCVSAGIYHWTHRGRRCEGTRPLLATLVLLSILVALVTLVIGNSVPRAFSLVGALAIVRFRTVVEDTRDTAFVIFSVVVGMAAGRGYLTAAVAVIPFVLLAAWLFQLRAELPPQQEQRLTLRLALGIQAEQSVQALLKDRLPGHRLLAVATARGGAALDITYAVQAGIEGAETLALVADLNRIEGVQSVELKCTSAFPQ